MGASSSTEKMLKEENKRLKKDNIILWKQINELEDRISLCVQDSENNQEITDSEIILQGYKLNSKFSKKKLKLNAKEEQRLLHLLSMST